MHPDWINALARLIPLILTTRILPKGLKITGRTLIDKSKTTDKRPISVLKALDSFLDTTVNSHLAQAIEKTQVLDHTIAAYRKGRSCNELSLNNILAIQDVINNKQTILAHIDEDKEKYFDRISTELQMLPLHIIGFPTHGYSEWIAESLSDLKINTSTPLGTVQNIYECGVRQGSALSCTIANMVAWLSASAWISPVTLQPDTITGSSVPHKGYIPHILSPNESEHANPQQLNTHSFCDDAGRYLSSTDPLELIDRIQYNLTISGYMSIVNKLGVRADKSKIRIYNISPTVDIPPFHYTAWNHSCRTVNTKNIPKEIHFTDGTVSTTATNRNLGVHNSMDGSTQIRHNNKIPYIKLQRNRLLRLHVSHQLFPTLYSALVSSHAVFNPLAIATPLNKYLKDDIQFLPRLKKFYHLHPKDEAHPIFLSAMIGGNAFKSITSILLQAYTRELMVLPNCPPRYPITTNHTLTRSLLHSTTSTPSIKPNSVYQTAQICSDAGFFIRHTSTVVINYALDNLAHINRHEYIPVGTTTHHPSLPLPSKVFDNLLTSTNRKFMMGSLHHRALLYACTQIDANYPPPSQYEQATLPYKANNLPATHPQDVRQSTSYYTDHLIHAHKCISISNSFIHHMTLTIQPGP